MSSFKGVAELDILSCEIDMPPWLPHGENAGEMVELFIAITPFLRHAVYSVAPSQTLVLPTDPRRISQSFKGTDTERPQAITSSLPQI